MKKFGRNTLAVGLATLLVTAAVSFSANGADPIVAQSKSSALGASGLFESLNLSSESCDATTTDKSTSNGTGNCGDGLNVTGVGAVVQTAKAGVNGDLKGVSEAKAATAQTDLANVFQDVDLTTVVPALQNIKTGTILDSVLGPLAQNPLVAQILTPLTDALQGVVDAALDPLGDALPLKLRLGAVDSQCTAGPDGATTGNGSVAGLAAVLTLPGAGDLVIPIDLGTAPNSPIIGYNEDAKSSAVQDIVDGVVDGLTATLSQSFDGALGAAAPLLEGLKDQILDPILQAVGPALLEPLGNLLDQQLGVVGGTVNKQVKTDGAIAVTALQLHLLGDANELNIGSVSCGPNTAAVDQAAAADDVAAVDDAADDSDTVADSEADADADAAADADSAADADVTTTLPNTGASANLLPFWLLGMALVAFGGAVLVNERRRTL